MVGRDGGSVEARQLETAVTVGCAHHRDFDALTAYSRHAARPVPFDARAALEDEAELGEKRDGRIEVFHHDADVIHPLDRHDDSFPASAQSAGAEIERAAAPSKRRRKTYP